MQSLKHLSAAIPNGLLVLGIPPCINTDTYNGVPVCPAAGALEASTTILGFYGLVWFLK